MELTIKIDDSKVREIIEQYVRNYVVIEYSRGKDVFVSSDSYSGLAAKVTIKEKEKDDGQ